MMRSSPASASRCSSVFSSRSAHLPSVGGCSRAEARPRSKKSRSSQADFGNAFSKVSDVKIYFDQNEIRPFRRNLPSYLLSQSRILRYGESQKVDISVEGVLRITLAVKAVSPTGGYAGWGDFD